MTKKQITLIKRRAEELHDLYARHGSLDPRVVEKWAATNPASALHKSLEWDNAKAALAYRLEQIRGYIVEVTVTYDDGKNRQLYVSPIQHRGKGGYLTMVEVMSHRESREAFLAQALDEYNRLGVKYREIKELSEVRLAVTRASKKRVRA